MPITARPTRIRGRWLGRRCRRPLPSRPTTFPLLRALRPHIVSFIPYDQARFTKNTFYYDTSRVSRTSERSALVFTWKTDIRDITAPTVVYKLWDEVRILSYGLSTALMYSMSRAAEQMAPGYDLAPLPGGATPAPADRAKSKRKQTLLSLLDALHELSKDGELDVGSTCLSSCLTSPSVSRPASAVHQGSNQQPSFEDDRDVRE